MFGLFGFPLAFFGHKTPGGSARRVRTDWRSAEEYGAIVLLPYLIISIDLSMHPPILKIQKYIDIINIQTYTHQPTNLGWKFGCFRGPHLLPSICQAEKGTKTQAEPKATWDPQEIAGPNLRPC